MACCVSTPFTQILRQAALETQNLPCTHYELESLIAFIIDDIGPVIIIIIINVATVIIVTVVVTIGMQHELET